MHFDSHTLGNLVKNLSPVAGTVIGGPLGLLAAGGLSAAGDLGRGKNIGQALKGGVENAALAGVGQAAGGALGYHGGLGALTGGGGSGAGATAADTAGAAPIANAPTAANFATGPSASGGLSGLGGSAITPLPASLQTLDGAASTAASAPSFASTAAPQTGRLSRLLDFAEAHPNATAGALQGLGGIASSSSENRLRNAQANALEQTGGITGNELAQRKASQAALAPLWSGFAQQPNARKPIAANPYASVTG